MGGRREDNNKKREEKGRARRGEIGRVERGRGGGKIYLLGLFFASALIPLVITTQLKTL